MKKILVLLLVVPFLVFGQETKKDSKVKTEIKKIFKFSTFYAGANGGSSLTDDDIYSITTGTLDQGIIETPFDYSIIFGVRKIARFGYLPKEAFKKGTEKIEIFGSYVVPEFGQMAVIVLAGTIVGIVIISKKTNSFSNLFYTKM